MIIHRGALRDFHSLLLLKSWKGAELFQPLSHCTVVGQDEMRCLRLKWPES